MQNWWKFQHRYFSCLNMSKKIFEMGFHYVALDNLCITMKPLSECWEVCTHQPWTNYLVVLFFSCAKKKASGALELSEKIESL